MEMPTHNQTPMSKSILIAGGTSGIGAQTATALLAEGHTVHCACRSPEKLPEHSRLHPLTFDATAEPELPLTLPDDVDGFVYFPGTITLKPFGRITPEEFLKDFQINFLGAVQLLQKVLPSLRKSPEASIVLFSTVAVQTGLPFHASIAAAKGAVEGLTRSLAAELAPRVRVNCIAPSLTDTALAAHLLSNDDKRKSSAERHPLKRIGDPKELAALVSFLLGSQSHFMTGNVIKADGGLSSVKLF